MKNKLVLISLIASIILGLLFSIDANMKIKEIETYTGNIIILIRDREFNIFIHTLKILFFVVIIYSVLLFAKVNFVLFMSNFVLVIIFSRMMFKMLFLAFLFDGIFAVIYLLFFWLPIMCYAMLCYFLCMCRIYNTFGYNQSFKRPLCCPSGNTYFYSILKSYACMVIPIAGYSLIFYIIVSIIT